MAVGIRYIGGRRLGREIREMASTGDNGACIVVNQIYILLFFIDANISTNMKMRMSRAREWHDMFHGSEMKAAARCDFLQC